MLPDELLIDAANQQCLSDGSRCVWRGEGHVMIELGRFRRRTNNPEFKSCAQCARARFFRRT